MEIGEALHVTDRNAWRDWLAANHATKREIWLIFYNKASGKPRLPYDDAVEEALCFGWIDSIVKKRDALSSAQRFTPRRPKSNLSETNRARVRRLIEQGLMSEAGLEAVRHLIDAPFSIQPDVLAALQADETVWRNFQALPESYRRIRIGWIQNARPRPELFQQRLDYFVAMTAQGKRFGMVQ